MAGKYKFKIKDLGNDLKTVRAEWGTYWQLVVYCEDAGLFQQEAKAVLLWVRGFTRKQIAAITGIDPSDVGRTIARGVRRIAAKYRPRSRSSVGLVWAVLKAFRNSKSSPDHGPNLSGTRQRGYREVFPPRMVDADDMMRERDDEPLAMGLLELIR